MPFISSRPTEQYLCTNGIKPEMRPTRHFYAGLIVRRERGPFALAHLSKQKQARQQPGLLASTV